MKRTLRAAAWLVLIGMIALGPFLAASLKAGEENRIREFHSSWAGVLRMWKYEGWQSGNGSLTLWLNACIESFEKKHPGVYIQMTDVSAESMKAFISGSANPPDLILYPPGLLDAPYSLMEVEEELPLRSALQPFGIWQERRYAVPVALGGYALAINSKLLPEMPASWGEQVLSEDKLLLDAPADGEYVSWSAALISLFAGSSLRGSDEEKMPVGEGIDLGLADAQPKQTKEPALTDSEFLDNELPARLPETFRAKESVYTRFTKGEIASIPVTQREIRRLQQLSETGKAPEWRAESIGLPFTDQAALVSAVAYEREDSAERQALCMELIHLMMTAQMQSKLTLSRAFPVIDLPALYQNQAGMREIEGALNSDDLLVPPAYGDEWRAYASRMMDAVGPGEGTQEARRKLQEAVRQ